MIYYTFELTKMLNHYLPNFDKKKSKAYTPMGVRYLLEDAIKNENGDIEAIFNTENKHKYKNLVELYHGAFLALAIKNWLKKEYVLYPSDSPDIYFLDNATKEAFPVEIMELYFHRQNNPFDGDYVKLAQHIFNKKGMVTFQSCHLLITSRMTVMDFNISKLYREMNKFHWNFERIWFGIYTENIQQWTFFEIYPSTNFNDKNFISFNLETDKNLFY